MRLAHSYSKPIYVVTMRAHILLCVAVCGAAEAGGRSFEVDVIIYLTWGSVICTIIISQSVNITKERDITGVEITNLA